MIDGNDTLLRKTEKGFNSNLDIKYQLLDDKSPVKIKFRTTSDDPEEKSFIVEIE